MRFMPLVMLDYHQINVRICVEMSLELQVLLHAKCVLVAVVLAQLSDWEVFDWQLRICDWPVNQNIRSYGSEETLGISWQR